MTSHDDLRASRELRATVDRLPRELRPGRDLWPEIAGRLERQPRRADGAGWWRSAAAAALLAAGLLASGILGPPDARPVARPGLPAASAAVPAMAAAQLRQRDGVLHAHTDLVSVVARRCGSLDEAGAAALATGLLDLEKAMAEIEAALDASPSSRRLRLALAAAYRRESGWAARFGRV